MSRVVLAMSGGVDSSVAAWLLRQEGHEVIGLFMRHGIQGAGHREWTTEDGGRDSGEHGNACRLTETNRHIPAVGSQPLFLGCPTSDTQSPTSNLRPPIPDPRSPTSGTSSLFPVRKQGCCTAADADDARRVAGMLGIPFYAVNFEEQFDRIVDYFVDQYTSGRTPNPCIMCNTWLKFGKLCEYAESVGARYVATGHYARIQPGAERQPPALLRGRDAAKDQSYVLFGVDRRLLGRFLLPVGEYRKDEVRRIAGQLGLRVAEKPDSQEICFVPDGHHARFVRDARPGVDTSGEIVTTAGEVVGRHGGLEQFTVGQRKGLGVAFGERRYVVRLEPERCRVVVGTLDDLACRELIAAEANWLVDLPQKPFSCQVKIRYRSPAFSATVEPLSTKGVRTVIPPGQTGPDASPDENNSPAPFSRFRVVFDEPCRGVAPGQAAVCYDGERVLGGGWIE
jgi:tRNA-uridine 2-sulfurtransferase